MKKKAQVRNIWMVSREYDPIAGAGGVKDVCRQLAEALVAKGCRVSVVLPRYGFIDPQNLGFRQQALALDLDMHYALEERRETVGFWKKKTAGVTLYLVEADRFREKRAVYTYTAEDENENAFHFKGSGHFDYFAVNVLLQKAALALLVATGQRPDVIHCHDGHTALLPAMLREIEGYRHYFGATGAVVTVHNAGSGYHQEVADLPFARAVTGLPQAVVQGHLLDGSFDPFLAAAPYAILNTVSENYARELRETDDDARTGWLGHRLLAHGVFLQGITNGINPADFSPLEPDRLGLAAAFDPAAGDLAGKRACRAALTAALQRGMAGIVQHGHLADAPRSPLFSFIGRFTEQKGVDVLLGALRSLLEKDHEFQILALGTGDRGLEQAFAAISGAERYRGRVCALQGFDPALANQVYAAGDFFLIPSRYEPCGLTDYIAQLFGNLPIVHHVGGLVKVVDKVTGFTYHGNTADNLEGAMRRAIRLYRENPGQLREMQMKAVLHIQRHYTWESVVERYLALYANALHLAPANRDA